MAFVADQSCNTPKNRPGVCIDIDSCPAILSILNNKRRSRNDTVVLKDSSCGFVNLKMKVCCELSSNDARNCTAPNNEAGVCSSDMLPPRPNCGKEASMYKTTQSKLMDGDSEIDQFPWLAVIEYKNSISTDPKSYYMCSAALISSRYVLTVAQCFYLPSLGGKIP